MGVPDFVRAAVDRYLAAGPSQPYPPRAGMPALREAVAAAHQEDGRAVEADSVVITAGATQALWACFGAFCAPGDVVLYPEPGFPHYRRLIADRGLDGVAYRVADDGRPDLAGALSGCDRAPALVIWNYPHNPTGSAGRAEWDAELARSVPPETVVVSDEVYRNLVYDPPARELPQPGPGAVAVGSFSKQFGLAGLRLGYVLASRESAARLADLVWTGSMGVPRLTQVAGLSALRLGSHYYAERVSELRVRRDRAAAAVRRLGLEAPTPEGGCFLWASTRLLGLHSGALVERLREELRVVAVPGSAFGIAKDHVHLRLSFGVSDEALGLAVQRLEGWAVAADASADGRRPLASDGSED